MSEPNLISKSEIAWEVTNNMNTVFDEMGDVTEVAVGDTNHNINMLCDTYFKDKNRMLDIYSKAAVRDAGKIEKVDKQLACLDEEWKNEMG